MISYRMTYHKNKETNLASMVSLGQPEFIMFAQLQPRHHFFHDSGICLPIAGTIVHIVRVIVHQPCVYVNFATLAEEPM